MRSSIYPSTRHRGRPAAAVCLAIILLAALPPAARPQNAPDGPDAREPLRIRADQLITDTQAGQAQFRGNVVVSQGNVEIRAERLTVTYRSPDAGAEAVSAAAAGPGAVERLEADGDVRIRLDDYRAQADRAVYTTTDRVLVLTGERAVITSGKDAIHGGRITFSRTDGRIQVDGAQGQPVEAVFWSRDTQLE